jgi:alcohol dehydrogenase
MLGAAHSCANPLTAYFNVVHGEAVGVMLPHVIRYNQTLPEVAAIYASLHTGDIADRITSLLAEAKMPLNLRHYGVTEADLPRLSALAAKQWTAQFNPRPVTESDFMDIYRAALTAGH